MSRRSIHFRQFRESTSEGTLHSIARNNSRQVTGQGRTRRYDNGKQTSGVKSQGIGTLPMLEEKALRLAAILHRTRS